MVQAASAAPFTLETFLGIAAPTPPRHVLPRPLTGTALVRARNAPTATYSHVIPSLQHEAAQRIDAVLGVS